MSLRSTLGRRADPVRTHNFAVSLVDSSSPLASIGPLSAVAVLDVAVGGFSECGGLEMAMTPEEYKEGGRNGAVLQFPNRVTWTHLTLKKGIGIGTALWDWQYGFVVGQGKRRDGTIVLLDEERKPAAMWCFRRGLPVKYSGPSLNATQSAVAIESLEIAHEGLYQVPGIGGVSAIVGAIAGAVG